MTNLIKLKKGYDIKLVGEAAKEFAQKEASRTYVVKPTEFFGITPKLLVEVGAEVKCGTPLFFAKNQPDLMFTSPVSGEVVEINRGEKRVILEIKILADGKMQHETFSASDPASLGRDGVKAMMLKSGCWTFLRQRPFNRLAEALIVPKNIFISGFDSAPLAPDLNFALKGHENHLQTGINALATLTDGKIFLGLKHGADNSTFQGLKNVTINHFDGPHPAGNVGIQIHHTAPINKGEYVWTINAQDVATL
ncbi:MAG: NADH:ubiquinone reductase (Na(+)-transporting) subunit A, partial [Bacteroidia bacterium]